jgi:hypothetical protein
LPDTKYKKYPPQIPGDHGGTFFFYLLVVVDIKVEPISTPAGEQPRTKHLTLPLVVNVKRTSRKMQYF